MKWRKKDPYRWKNKFALWPVRIGDNYIWLEPYRVRLVSWELWEFAPGITWKFEREHDGVMYTYTVSDC